MSISDLIPWSHLIFDKIISDQFATAARQDISHLFMLRDLPRFGCHPSRSAVFVRRDLQHRHSPSLAFLRYRNPSRASFSCVWIPKGHIDSRKVSAVVAHRAKLKPGAEPLMRGNHRNSKQKFLFVSRELRPLLSLWGDPISFSQFIASNRPSRINVSCSYQKVSRPSSYRGLTRIM